MRGAGVIDMQSHSMHHATIPVSPRVIDFFNPSFRYFRPWDIPVDRTWIAGLPGFPPPYGRPMFESASRLK